MFRMNLCCVHDFTEGIARDSRKTNKYIPSVYFLLSGTVLRGTEAREEKRRESDCEMLWSIVK